MGLHELSVLIYICVHTVRSTYVHVNYYTVLFTIPIYIYIFAWLCGDYQTGNEIDRSDLVDPRGPLNSTISRRLRAFLILPAGLARRNPFEGIRISQLLNIPNGLIRVISVFYIRIYTSDICKCHA